MRSWIWVDHQGTKYTKNTVYYLVALGALGASVVRILKLIKVDDEHTVEGNHPI